MILILQALVQLVTFLTQSKLKFYVGRKQEHYGANAAGGLVKIVTNDPTPYWTGQTEGTLGNDSLVAGGFAIGGPLLENDPEQITFRFSLIPTKTRWFP